MESSGLGYFEKLLWGDLSSCSKVFCKANVGCSGGIFKTIVVGMNLQSCCGVFCESLVVFCVAVVTDLEAVVQYFV